MDTKKDPTTQAVIAAQSKNAKQQQRKYAKIVGYFALGIPLILWLGPELFSGCKRYSISHFYYSPLYGSIFIGMLAFVGVFLIAYDSERCDEKFLAKLAGACALGVAFLPAVGHGCLDPEGGKFRARAFQFFNVEQGGKETLALSNTNENTLQLHDPAFFTFYELELVPFLNFTHIHYIVATGLFLILLYFCFVIFVHAEDRHKKDGETLTNIKKIRNTIYVVCGSIIYLSILKLGLTFLHEDPNIIDTPWNRSRGTFRWEAYALIAFGISWLVKGRFISFLVDDKEKEENQPAAPKPSLNNPQRPPC